MRRPGIACVVSAPAGRAAHACRRRRRGAPCRRQGIACVQRARSARCGRERCLPARRDCEDPLPWHEIPHRRRLLGRGRHRAFRGNLRAWERRFEDRRRRLGPRASCRRGRPFLHRRRRRRHGGLSAGRGRAECGRAVVAPEEERKRKSRAAVLAVRAAVRSPPRLRPADGSPQTCEPDRLRAVWSLAMLTRKGRVLACGSICVQIVQAEGAGRRNQSALWVPNLRSLHW